MIKKDVDGFLQQDKMTKAQIERYIFDNNLDLLAGQLAPAIVVPSEHFASFQFRSLLGHRVL